MREFKFTLGDLVKWLVIFLVIAALFFVGYKVFYTQEWKWDDEYEQKYNDLKREHDSIVEELSIVRKENDSIGKVNDTLYTNWQNADNALANMKSKYDKARRNNANMSADERTSSIAEWLNN